MRSAGWKINGLNVEIEFRDEIGGWRGGLVKGKWIGVEGGGVTEREMKDNLEWVF
jgi:hypothetical protein